MPFPEVLDSSIVNDLKKCPAKFSMAHCQDWKGFGTNVHLKAGGAFASGCEAVRRAYYMGEYKHWRPEGVRCATHGIHYGGTGCGDINPLDKIPGEWYFTQGPDSNRELAIQNGVEVLMKEYGDFEAPTYGSGAAKTLDRMAGALIFYWDNYPLNHNTAFPVMLPGNKRGIEFNFTEVLPIDHPETGNPLLYTGRLDAVLNFAGGTWGFDEKTTSSLGSSWGDKWGLRGQFIGYTWGCRQAGLPIKGIVVRGVSILKTKYECQESINEFPGWMVDQWYVELLEWLTDAKAAYLTKRWKHNYGDACDDFGGCAFKRACAYQDPLNFLSTNMERRHWDPITRTETPIPLDAPL